MDPKPNSNADGKGKASLVAWRIYVLSLSMVVKLVGDACVEWRPMHARKH